MNEGAVETQDAADFALDVLASAMWHSLEHHEELDWPGVGHFGVAPDGFFHVATWILVATASLLTARAWQRRELAPPWRAHFGLLLAGWGKFNLVEGPIDHEFWAFITCATTSVPRWAGISRSSLSARR